MAKGLKDKIGKKRTQIVMDEPQSEFYPADKLHAKSRQELMTIAAALRPVMASKGWGVRVIWNSQTKGLLCTDDSWLPF